MNKFISWVKLHQNDKCTYILIVAISWVILELFHRDTMDKLWDYLFLDLGSKVITAIVTSPYFTGQMASLLVAIIVSLFKVKKSRKNLKGD